MTTQLAAVRNYYKGLFHFFLISMIYSFWFIYSYKSIKDWHAFFQLFAYATICILITYTDVYFLFKSYFLKRKITVFIITSLLLFLTGSFILQRIYEASWSSFFHSFASTDFYVETVVLVILCTAFSGIGITYVLFSMWMEGERTISDLSEANVKAELENLKKQISPHFLFNTLNNLYVLAKTKPSLAADAILELADLVKYQLYECTNERVPLKKEMEYIRSLLSLEQLRKEKWVMNIRLPKHVSETIHIAPLIFITLIENAIKHGSQQLYTGIIDIQLLLLNEQLIFEIVNSKPVSENPSQKRPAIGLNNLRRRLELLYPGRHSLTLLDNVDQFTATLILNL